ncbi:MAG: nuclear transport factor 2 family protein [Planctomycetes bacterium]|nr:nuclear transport factor 2 family protein [Planctomycetota bacterium]
MNQRLFPPALTVIAVTFAWSAATIRADDATTIPEFEQQLADAVVKGDVATFDRLFADDFTHGSQSGRFRTKAEWMKGKQQGKSAYVSFDCADVQVRVSGDTAVVTGLAKPQWREGSRIASGQFRFLRVWAKRDGRWQVVAFQSTNVPAPSDTPTPEEALDMDDPPATREFSIQDDSPCLDGQQIKIWGLRCGNALYDQGVTERHVRNLDNMVAHGINCIGVYVQGSNAGHPDPFGGRSGYTPEGKLKPEFARRLEWLVREADRRDMVVMVGLFSPRKDDELEDEAAIRRACEETAKFLGRRKLRNVFCDIMHEYNHSRIDHDIFREPNGAEKKATLTKWFNAVAPGVEAGVCPTYNSGSSDSYPGMMVRIIQKEAEIPKSGFVVNVETQRHDAYENDGKYEADEFPIMFGYFKQYQAAPNACMLFHSGWCQGITNGSGTAPHPEMGGYGKSEDDRGIRFYYEWVRYNIGRYEYPHHVKGPNTRDSSAR